MRPRNWTEWAEQVFVDPNETAMESATYTNVEPENEEDDEDAYELPVRYVAP